MRTKILTESHSPTAAKFLERALMFTIVCHAVAMVSMLMLLLPGMPGGSNHEVADRVTYISAHPLAWRLGWFPWQLTALSDLLLGIALLRTLWIPKFPAWIATGLTLVAIWFEQPAEFRWITEGVDLARQATYAREYGQYLAFESRTFHLTSHWAALFYTLAAIAWSVSLARAGTWNRLLTILSVVLWGLLIGVSFGPLVKHGLSPAVVSAGNAVGFILMMLWFVLVAELVLRRARPDAKYGRLAPSVLSVRGPWATLFSFLVNSRLVRAFGEIMPTPAFASDITDVVYMNYLVDADQLEQLVPDYLQLRRLGPDKQHSILTILIFRHGHFGPAFLGPLRRFMPSPIQSNWRIHVLDLQTDTVGVHFFTMTSSNPVSAILARVFAEGMSMHVPATSVLSRADDGSIQVRLESGSSSAPDLVGDFMPDQISELPVSWGSSFTDVREFLEYVVPQDRMMTSQPWYRQVSRQEIELGIPIDACEPLMGTVHSHSIESLVGQGEPICFRVAQVRFRFDRQLVDPRKIAVN